LVQVLGQLAPGEVLSQPLSLTGRP
jgi:hypothetical protein